MFFLIGIAVFLGVYVYVYDKVALKEAYCPKCKRITEVHKDEEVPEGKSVKQAKKGFPCVCRKCWEVYMYNGYRDRLTYIKENVIEEYEEYLPENKAYVAEIVPQILSHKKESLTLPLL